MPRLIATVILVGFALIPVAARAQATALPRLELSTQVSTQTGNQHAATWSPRLTFAVAPLSALEVTADLRPTTADAWGTRSSAQSYGLHLRQTLWSRGRLQVFGVVGGGREHTTVSFRGRVLETRDGMVTYGPYQFSEDTMALHIGTAVQFEASPYLALRSDLRLAVGQDAGLRGMIGGVIPLGRRFQADSSRANPLAGHDSLANGMAIGAATGGVALGLTSGVYAGIFCGETNDCGVASAALVIVGTVTGAALGGVVGAVVDSLIIHTTPTSTSAAVAVRWR